MVQNAGVGGWDPVAAQGGVPVRWAGDGGGGVDVDVDGNKGIYAVGVLVRGRRVGRGGSEVVDAGGCEDDGDLVRGVALVNWALGGRGGVGS